MSGVSARSLAKGSAPPGPVPEGKIRVYSMRFCPYARRTLLVLKAKGIGHEIININLKNKPDWFFKKNPLGLVPVLENSQGQLIYESVITCEYLDEVYPGKKLWPDDPYEKACQKILLESFSKMLSLMLSFPRKLNDSKQNKEECAGIKEELRKEFSKLEEEDSETEKAPKLSEASLLSKLAATQGTRVQRVLTNKKTTFFGGNSVSMIDYLIWPWFERQEPGELTECVSHTPKLKQWMTAMREDPAVSAFFLDAKSYQGFFRLYLQNSHEACDYGL